MYIFGIDLPIMELLFIFSLIFIIALVIIWLEIKKLRGLISAEKEDIGGFEKNLKKKKSDGKEKHSQTLEGFIKSALNKGFTKEQIERSLTEKGWTKESLEKAFSKFNIE